MKIKHIGIVYNEEKDKGLCFTNQVIGHVTAFGCKPILDENEIYRISDFILVLGGDGTMLQAAHHAAFLNIPLLGVNLGTLGYLTDIEPNEIDQGLNAVLNGNYRLEKRIMLQTDLNHSRAALNDIVISRSNLKLLRYQLYINNDYIDSVRADGIIISTPTGSTAYNLSAGGPILKPDSEMTVITAICPHALYLRPWVISADDTVGVRVTDGGEAILAMDGRIMAAPEPGRLLSVTRSPMYTSIIKTKPLGFYEILRRKLIKKSQGEAE